MKISKNEDVKVSDIEVITEDERELILNTFNDTKTDYPKDKTLVELFEEQVKKTPDNTAVVFEDKQLTYAELNRKVNQVARKLRELNVKPNDFVAIIAERSIEMIVGIYGIIKAGGAYVPIDPKYPEDRIKYMIQDCKPKAILVYKAGVKTKVPVINLEEKTICECEGTNFEKVNKPNDLACCIYTSGTTGKPKGTMIEHKSIIRLVKNSNYFRFEDVRMLQTGSISFDAATFEIWGTLLNAGRLYLANKNEFLEIKNLKRIIEDNNINTMFLTTALFNQIVSIDCTVFNGLKTLMFGGEK
ncbi:AMP-binding protein, partial [Clostridium felsineum]|uniref:AMP-binding protein n=1 Tax=Clostridium felsineum TaxID=36839 RepID=UPI00214D3634